MLMIGRHLYNAKSPDKRRQPQGSCSGQPGSGRRAKKRYSPRERERGREGEYSERDLQTVRHSSKNGRGGAKGKWSGIIKTHEVIEKRNEVKSL